MRLLVPLSIGAILLLAGCAAKNAYRAGVDLASTGNTAGALVKFEEAAQLDQRSPEFRIATIQTRERLVIETLAVANQMVDSEKYAEAKLAFNRVLGVQPGNARSIEGLKRIDAIERHGKWLASAESALANKDEKTAQMWARMVLTEDAKQRKALAIIQSIEQAADKAPVANALSDSYKKPISIEFKDAPLKSVFEVISRSSGLNFLFDKDVKTDQKTSIFLKNSSIEAAINLTLLTNQLEQRVLDANSILIYPNTQAKQKDYQPLSVKAFYLANAEAKNVANTLKTILKSRDVVVDDKLNMLILRDSPEAIRLAEKLVQLQDVAEPEVMLEVEILEVKRTRLLDLGIRWPDQLSLSPLASSTAGLTIADLRNVNQGTTAVTIGSTVINAKKLDTDANILANPRIRARNREQAKILIGERVPNITSTSTATGFVAESVNYVDVGLKLDVEPTIYTNGEVAIKIALEVSNIINQLQTKSGSIAYQIGTRTAQTVLRLKDGENQVLAGLINDEDRRTANKVPGAGEIPIVGRLFGNQADDTSKTEIVLSITPRILRNIEKPNASTIEFESGTESSLGARGASTGGATVGASAGAASQNRTVAPATNSQTPANSGVGSANRNGVLTPVATPIDPNAALPGTARLTWQGPNQLKVGDSFSMQLVMQSNQPVVSIPMAVGFDPRALQVSSVVEGEFLKQSGGKTTFSSRVDPSGQIVIANSVPTENGAVGQAVVASLNFRVIGSGVADTNIQLLSIAPVGLAARGIPAPLPLPHAITIVP